MIPHHNTFGKGWAPKLAAMLPGVVLIGIDEQTGMIDDGPQGLWTVYGKGAVTLYREGVPTVLPCRQYITIKIIGYCVH